MGNAKLKAKPIKDIARINIKMRLEMIPIVGIQKLSNMRNLTKIAISQATFGVRRPMSTTFVDIFKGYNAVVHTKIKFQEKVGQINPTTQSTCTHFDSGRLAHPFDSTSLTIRVDSKHYQFDSGRRGGHFAEALRFDASGSFRV